MRSRKQVQLTQDMIMCFEHFVLLNGFILGMCVQGVFTADVNVECPTPFSYAKPNPVICQVNRSRVGCATGGSPVTVQFIVHGHDADPGTLKCRTDYACLSPAEPTGDNTCNCISDKDGILTFKFLFDTDKRDEGLSLECSLCPEADPSFTTDSQSCNSIQFEEPSFEERHPWVIVLTVVGGVIIVAIVVIVLVYVKKGSNGP